MSPTDALRTDRLTLRPLDLADVDALWPYVSDPELPRFMTWEAHKSRDETTAFVTLMMGERAKGAGYVWTMREGDAVLGLVGLHGVTRQHLAWRMDKAELGYWIGGARRNRGLTTEASREVMRYGFEELALHKVTVGCVADNAPSKRVIERLGFRFVGVQRDHLFRFGRWWDHLSYELVVDEWRAQQRAGATTSTTSS